MCKLTSDEVWSFAIGIVQTEGRKPSDFMMGLMKKEKKGEITSKDIKRMLIEHYTQSAQKPDSD
jgi:hypothetical protein